MSGTAQTTEAGLNCGLVFRLGDEWLAVDSRYVRDVTRLGGMHSLPQCRNTLFRGLVNVRGKLQVCIALERLLQLNRARQVTRDSRARLISLAQRDQQFFFAVDEVCGVHRFSDEEVELFPTTVSRFRNSLTLGMLGWGEREVGVLDHEQLFHALTRSLQ